MSLRKAIAFVFLGVLSTMVSLWAHDLPMGASRWSFGKDSIRGFIDLKSNVFAEIEPIKHGNYHQDTASGEELQQLATGVIQSYLNPRLTIAINGRTYPLVVERLTRNENNLYTICLSVANVRFDRPKNEIRIAYSLLFAETRNEHFSMAYGYLTDATGEELQKVFDYSPPAFQTTFDAGNTNWSLGLRGAPAAASVRRASAASDRAGTAASLTAEAVATAAAPQGQSERVSQASLGAPDAVSAPPAPSSAAPPSAGRSLLMALRQFVPLGIAHILTGYDHIAFLLAIIVIELSVREILKIITAFTLAHSITLLLAAMELVHVNSRLVECVIAFSICYVAMENVFRRKVNYRWCITFAFGLIHGFGFAGALRELMVGKANLLFSVVCFNAGVEAGQLMLFFVLLPVLYLLKKRIGFRTVTVATSVAVFGLGFTWLLERVLRLKLLWF